MFYKNKYGTWKYTMKGGMINNSDNSDEEEEENEEEEQEEEEDDDDYDDDDDDDDEEDEEPIVRLWNADDYRYASSNRPRFAELDRLMDTKSYHIETYVDDDGNTRQRRVRTQKDKDHYNKVQDALYSLGYYR